jgi:hypothetical protein
LRIPAATKHLKRSIDGLLKLDRQGKLDGRPHEKNEVLPAYRAELAACEAVAATAGDLSALKAQSSQQASRLLRIRVGVLAAEGRFGELVATADALLGMNAEHAEDLYELGRSLAWCAGYLDQSTTAKPATQELKTLRQRFGDRAVAVLVRAVEQGLRDARRLEVDVVLAPIRQHAGFPEITARIKAPNRSAKL